MRKPTVSLWTCPTCHTTKPEYLRDIHLKLCPRPSENVTDLWTCIQCNIQMNVSSKDSHLAGKRHRKALNKQDPVPDSIGSDVIVPIAGEWEHQSLLSRAHMEFPEGPKFNGKKSGYGIGPSGGLGGSENQGSMGTQNSGKSTDGAQGHRGRRGPPAGSSGRGDRNYGSGGGDDCGGGRGSSGGGGGGSGDGGRGGRGRSGRGRGGRGRGGRGRGGRGGGGGGRGGGGGGGGGSGGRSRRERTRSFDSDDARSILYDIDTAFGVRPHGGAYKESNVYSDLGDVLY